MKYRKPRLLAKNKITGSYAAGCPPKDRSTIIGSTCIKCERKK